ncbi:hypothetical protein GWI33_020885 [Rhynchophorus ferrugineus]|uniref:SKICH domain-containing protein n=1 Tax=Rhynchophorus ferrugineus TaxID=354439 RepID=A0A834I2L4_RHYFE|nr:hypothetical protein GWI33_020885 [Rhynchophorus ferrugineus]
MSKYIHKKLRFYTNMISKEDVSLNFSDKQLVKFIDISDEYGILEDIKFTIKLNDYQIQEGDRIAIYKIGWKEVQDYEIFDWAPTNTTDMEIPFHFKGSVLPKNLQSLYQICYISGDNQVKGASTPFHIQALDISVNNTLQEHTNLNKNIFKDCKQILVQHQRDIENCNIKLLKMINNCIAHQQSQYNDIFGKQELYTKLISDQKDEIQNLRDKIIKIEEDYQKLYAEKNQIQNKYESLKMHIEIKKKVDGQNLEDNQSFFEFQSIPQFPAISEGLF